METKIDNPFRDILRLSTACRRVLSGVCAELENRGIDITEPGDLALLGAIDDGCWMADITENGWELARNVSRTAARLRSRGYVEVKSGLDRRRRRVALTDKGRDVLAIAKPLAAQIWRDESAEIEVDKLVVSA